MHNHTAKVHPPVCSLWDYDDMPPCARQKVVGKLLPVILTLGFILVTVYKFATYKKKVDLRIEEEEPLLNTTSASYNGEARNVKDEHFSIEKLKFTDKDGKPHGEIEVVTRDWSEKFRVIIEFILLLLQVAIHSYVYINYSKVKEFVNIQYTLGMWVWLLTVGTIRLLNINQKCSLAARLGNLWTVSFVSYSFLAHFYVFPFRSVYIGHVSKHVAMCYYKSQFYINWALCLILITAKIGNKHALLYKTRGVTPSPENVTSIWDFISWGWLDTFVWTAHKTTIKLNEIWGLAIDDYAIFVLRKFKKYASTRGQAEKFTRNLLSFFSKYLLLQAFWACIDSICQFIPTILLKRILEYVDDRSSAPRNLAWFYVFGMFACRFFVAVSSGQALFFGRRVCVRMRAILISEIYTKALRRKISPNSAKQSTDEVDPQALNDEAEVDGDEESTTANLGAIINLMSVDAFKISEICAYLHQFISAIIMTVIALGLLYNLLGWSALVGASAIVVLIPINFKLANWLGRLQKKGLAITDKRIQKLNECFQAIRIIKFFAWEENFEKDINDVREAELRMLLLRSLVWAASSFVWFITPTLVTTLSFYCYIFIQGQTLTTPVAFTALSLFTLLRNPLDVLSDMLSYVIQSKVSLDRVQDFLLEEETDKYQQLTLSENRIGFDNATFTWDRNSQDFKLKNLSVDFKVGKLNVVIGATGSGKTSLLMGLLGEMELLEGKVYTPSLDAREELVMQKDGLTNSIAYCSQAAWLLNDTVRQNILFNTPYNEKRYRDVVAACGLSRDFEILSAGDQTEIGEKGITLSGGQKQRVSLARALYSSARHLLLDDCLSAVDSHTALWIYENCITGPLMENRTCILVSHNVALTVKQADWVLVLENGRVKAQGEPLELLRSGHLGTDELVKTSLLSRTNSSVNLSKAAGSTKAAKKPETTVDESNKKGKTDEELAAAGKLIEEESKSDGVVSWDVYAWFAHHFGGLKMVLFLVVIFITSNTINIGQSWWVRTWASQNMPSAVVKFFSQALPQPFVNSMTPLAGSSDFSAFDFSATVFSSNTTSAVIEKIGHSTAYYLSLYCLIGVLYASVGSAKTIINFVAGINASRKIFKLVLKQVMYSKLRFFDSTPIGRIMNRFSKDIEAVDQELTPFMEGSFMSLVQCISTIILIGMITPGFLGVAVFVGFLYYLVGYFYMCGSRELKRFESITKSPIHQHFSETLVGITTIRAYGDERRFMLDNLNKIDENNKPFFYLWVANRWLAFRIDMIGAIVVFAAGVFILLSIDTIDAGLAGISLTYAISFTDSALWLVRLYSNVEMTMNSVERLKEYMVIDQEPSNIGAVTPSPQWPEAGKIEVNNVSLRYAPSLPRVIKNVTFTVEPTSKVGIVGRTGAGKSTIITALFRFLDPETGFIKIDNVDITSVGLHTLRRGITIIPQDPTLFTGTIKSNLDPYNEYSDEQIFEALKRVNLITAEELAKRGVVTSDNASENINKFLDLKNEITEGGNNLSQGQRQLVCLARSLLRSPKVMLLDEATASIDYTSDARIQQTIREEFNSSTILTIAHRLRSIIDYDKILVMDAGEVKEYDHPYSLLMNKESIFYSMCEDSGELDILVQLAKESFVKKLNAK